MDNKDWNTPQNPPPLTGEYLVATTDGLVRVLDYREDGWWLGTTRFGSNAISGWMPAPSHPKEREIL